MIQLVLKHYVDVLLKCLLEIADPSENSIWLNCSPLCLVKKNKKHQPCQG